MKPASALSNSVALVSSLDVEKAGPTTPEFATVFITSAARAASGLVSPSWMSCGFSEFSSMMEPPADSTSALSHTTSDSARRPCALRILPCSWAAVTSCSQDRKSTRLNSSHANISYAVFCLKKKKKTHGRKRDGWSEQND